MRKAFVILLLLLLTACTPKPLGNGFVPTVTVEGDVGEVFELNRESADELSWTKVEAKGALLPCIAMADVIEKACPRTETYDLLLIAADGYSVLIGGDDLGGAFIAFSSDYGWECVNLNHPVSSKVKTLQRIIVVSAEGTVELADAEGTRLISAGQLAMLPLRTGARLLGRAEQNGNFAEVYAFIARKPISELLVAEKEITVIGRDGSVSHDRDFWGAALELRGNVLDYVFASGERVTDAVKIIADGG